MPSKIDPYGYGKFCPICALPTSPIGILTSCPAHGELMFLEAAMAQEGDVSCSSCGKTIRKRYTFCPDCGKRNEQ